MAATKPAFNPPGKKGDKIFSALVKLAALIVLLMLGGIIVSLIISSWPSIEKFGFSFLWTKDWTRQTISTGRWYRSTVRWSPLLSHC
ncbi:phosphate transporter permease subunit PstC [Citrobacter amalonaticus]|nr:phosphate transporter permease subunit PstC [Citrobacter amalonaticus]